MKPPTPMLAPEQRPLKPPSPLQPKNARETPISHPQRRRRFHARDFRCSRAIAEPGRAPSQRAEPHISDQAPPVWRAPEGPEGARGPGCGARGRRRGLAGLRDDAPSEAHGADGSRAGRRPRAHKAARPHSRARRRPKHQRHRKRHRKVRTPRSTPGSGRPGGRRGGRGR